MKFFQHEKAIVDSEEIGNGTRIWDFVHVLKNARIGQNCNICAHGFIENDVVVGDNVTIKCGVYLWDGITIKDNVFIGANVTFTNDKYPRSKQDFNLVKTIIEEWATIGAGTTIIGGVTIGEYSFVGAGSVVTKSIPNNALYYGNPAKLQGYVCKCGHKLDNNFICPNCKKEYELSNVGIKEIETTGSAEYKTDIM